MNDKLKKRPYVDFRPARLVKGKIWYIEFYARDPITKKMRRNRIKCNQVKDPVEKKKWVNTMLVKINNMLYEGWNPFTDEQAPRGHSKLIPALDSYLRLVKKEKREATSQSYHSILGKFKTWIEKKKKSEIICASITSSLAVDYLDYLSASKEIAPRTYNNNVRVLKTFFKWMEDNQYMGLNPFEKITKKKEGHKTRIQYVPDDIRDRIKNYLAGRNDQMLLMCYLAYHCLIRPKEMTYLKIKNVDLKRQQIHLSGSFTKNCKDRFSTIPNTMMEFISLYISGRDPELYLFSQAWGPGEDKMHPRRIGKYWEKLREDLGLDYKFKFYSLRDSGIIQKIRDNVPLDEIMYQADHSSLDITNKYARVANPGINLNIRDNTSSF